MHLWFVKRSHLLHSRQHLQREGGGVSGEGIGDIINAHRAMQLTQALIDIRECCTKGRIKKTTGKC